MGSRQSSCKASAMIQARYPPPTPSEQDAGLVHVNTPLAKHSTWHNNDG